MSAAAHRVLVADAIALDGLAPLAEDGRFALDVRPGLAGDALADALADADAVLVRSATKITRASLARADRLRVIGRAGAGTDTIDVDAATERGVAVLTAPAGNTISAAELTLALLLALVRRVPAADRSMRAGEWDRKSFSGTELYGKTLGLVGAGRIGTEVATRARAFGMRVAAFDPFLSAERARSLGFEPATLDEVLARADVLTLHVPLTDATAGLVGAEQIARMKRSALIVNVARGGVVDEAALLQALREKRIAGAALDVFEAEPLPKDHPFRTLENVVLTPHLGASTAEAQQNVAVEIAEAVRDALLHGDLSRAVNAPSVAGDELRRLRPALDLARRLGALAGSLAGGALSRLEVRHSGEAPGALRLLAANAVVGALTPVVGEHGVNVVNALHLASQRGVKVEEVREGPESPYAARVEVRAASDAGESTVAGAILGESHARIVRIDEFHVDLVPRGSIVVLRNRDVPGVIGRVGTLLGEAGVNIAEYHQARLGAGGDALAAVSVDGQVARSVLDSLRAIPEVRDVRQADLGA